VSNRPRLETRPPLSYSGVLAAIKVTNVNLSSPALNAGSATSTNAPRDIKPPLEIPGAWSSVIWVVLLLIATAVLFIAFRYVKTRRAQARAVPPVPPHVRAKRRLNEAMALIAHPREFCIAVSDIVRCYLEERFDFRAPERTTEEFLRELQLTDLLTVPQKDSLRGFLERCDLVKFARYEPAEPELRDLHNAAFSLVEETEPKVIVEGAHVPEPAGATNQEAKA
jgi:hypothetical protein